jgi:hypothetical protein
VIIGGRPDHIAAARSKTLLRYDAQVCRGGRRRAIAVVAPGDGPKTRNKLLRFGERNMAAADLSTGCNEAAHCSGKLVESCLDARVRDAGYADRANEPRLKLGHFAEGGVNHFLYSANLGREFKGGVLNLMLSHVTAPFRAIRITRIWLPK